MNGRFKEADLIKKIPEPILKLFFVHQISFILRLQVAKVAFLCFFEQEKATFAMSSRVKVAKAVAGKT